MGHKRIDRPGSGAFGAQLRLLAAGGLGAGGRTKELPHVSGASSLPSSFSGLCFEPYRLLWPRDSFLIFFFLEPRGSVRFALGAAFLRAARFNFLRSCVSSIFVVFAMMSRFLKCRPADW